MTGRLLTTQRIEFRFSSNQIHLHNILFNILFNKYLTKIIAGEFEKNKVCVQFIKIIKSA